LKVKPTFWIKTASLFLFRSRRMTLALGLMISFAVGTLVFISAIAVGINDSMIHNSTSLYSGYIAGVNLPVTLSREDLIVDGVTTVLQRYQIPGTLHHQGKNEMIMLIAVDPARELKNTAVWRKVVKGRYIENNKSGILINQDTAQRLNVYPGMEIIFRSGTSEYPLFISGIFKTGIDRLDNKTGFCPVSLFSDRPANWDCAVFLEPGADLKTIMASYDRKGFHPYDLRTWKELMPDLVQLIELNRISMTFVMVLVLGVVCFGTACTFAIFIISSIREYGVMKAMGVTPGETVMLIFSEVVLMNFAASFFGALCGFLMVFITSRTGIDLSSFTSHNQYFVVSGLIIPRLTLFSFFLPSILAMVFCLFAAVWPALIVIRQKPADILRSI